MKCFKIIIFGFLTLLSCGSSSDSTKSTNYSRNPHVQAHMDMHQEHYKEELTKEIYRKLDEIVGLYTGTIPCDDCDGIEMELELFADMTYSLKKTYLGSSESPVLSKGDYTLGDNWKIQMNQTGSASRGFFQKHGNDLKVLDQNGMEFTGEMVARYFLRNSNK